MKISDSQKTKSDKKITIFNGKVEIFKKHMPELYKWAKMNPRGLEKTISSMAKNKREDFDGVMITLESDMRTDYS